MNGKTRALDRVGKGERVERVGTKIKQEEEELSTMTNNERSDIPDQKKKKKKKW